MKKIIAVVLSVFVSISFMACTQAENNNDDLLVQEIAALTQRIDELTAELEKSREENKKTQEQVQAQSETIELMQRQLSNLRGNPIEYTETAPAFGYPTDYTVFQSFGNSSDGDELTGFNRFKEYMLNDFCKNYPYEFCILSPGYNSGVWERRKKYQILVENIAEDGAPVSPMVYQYMEIYTEELGMYEYLTYPGEGILEVSFRMTAYFVPAPLEDIYEHAGIILKYGQQISEGYAGNYINIYMYHGEREQVCVGTCYYNSNVYISDTWFRHYFEKNLIRSTYKPLD